jgi:ribosomal protein S18 acetylase RimI-like enzyme
MSTHIVVANVSQAAIIATIGKKTFRHAFEDSFINREELFEYLEYTYDPVKLTKSLRKENNIYLLACDDSQPAGFAKLKKHSLHDDIEFGSQMELQKLYVLPAHQGKGIGSALLQEVKSIARDAYPDFLWLDTPVTNDNAIRLYERNGFYKISTSFFNIGSQTFRYHVMGMPIASEAMNAC